jgi:hypothetical protein
MIDIALGPCEQIVYANDLIATSEQTLNQVGAQEACSTSNQSPLARIIGL